MKSLERRFKNIQNKKKNSDLGDYCCLARAVKYQKFSKRVIAHWFNKLMSKEDYLKSEKRSLISQLVCLSNDTEEGKKRRNSTCLTGK